MKRFLSVLIPLSVMALCMTGCFFLDNTLLYTDTGMAIVKDSHTLLTDTGMTYHISENQAGALDVSDRIMYQCDVLSKTDGNDNEYEVRLTTFAKVMVKDPVPASTVDIQTLGNDGIGIDQGWIASTYVNALVQYTTATTSSTEHDIDIVYDDVKSNADTIYFKLCHNAHGDCFENESIDAAKIAMEARYISFKVSDYAEGRNSTFVIRVAWDWYKLEDNVFIREKEEKYTDFSCRR